MTLCPLDEKDDAIQRIQALILEDQVYTSKNGDANSALSTLLAPPDEPAQLNAGFFLLWWVVLLIPAIALLPLIFPMILWIRKYRAAYRERKGFAQNCVRWEKAIGKWERLFYCHRCGIVFDPVSGEHCLPREMDGFLYREE